MPMSQNFKAGDKIGIHATIEIPVDATFAQVSEWIADALSYRSGIKLTNPLRNFDIEAKNLGYSENR